jgi:hypothetical protein
MPGARRGQAEAWRLKVGRALFVVGTPIDLRILDQGLIGAAKRREGSGVAS